MEYELEQKQTLQFQFTPLPIEYEYHLLYALIQKFHGKFKHSNVSHFFSLHHFFFHSLAFVL